MSQNYFDMLYSELNRLFGAKRGEKNRYPVDFLLQFKTLLIKSTLYNQMIVSRKDQQKALKIRFRPQLF